MHRGAPGILEQKYDSSGLGDVSKGVTAGAPVCLMQGGPSVTRESCEGGTTTQEVERGGDIDAGQTEGKLGTSWHFEVSAHSSKREAPEGTKDYLWGWG